MTTPTSLNLNKLNFISTETDGSGDKKDEVLFSLGDNKLASNRVEAQLKELQSDKDIYLNNKLDIADYKVTEDESKEGKLLLDSSASFKTLREEEKRIA
ncbi:unnamed protein product [Ambrosiozyma monospora]|uniref:Unnamed protein product n=1 Tax=Ambrosiozyma monospora TaxID=43982 RepID=A0ACB5UC08_AMBMO|nr:unnamed protein product [Ambrosiozyma monospora]